MISIDRIEGAVAVCEREDRTMAQIPLSRLPSGVKEGDCLMEVNGHFVVDAQETQRRREEVLSLHAKLLRKK